MRIGVDMDGVVYEWERTARYMLRTYRGQHQLTEPSVAWDGVKNAVAPEEWQWLWTEGVAKGLFLHGHMVTGARVGLERLADAGHKLVIITHRPESAVLDTMEWVTLHFKGIPLAGFNVLSDGDPKSTVRYDLLIDDKPENVADALDAGRLALLFSRPWNRGTGFVQERVHGWPEVVRRLT